MLNEHPTEQMQVGITEAQVAAMIDARLVDVLRREEFEKRLADVQVQAHLEAAKLVNEKIAEVEARLNANVTTLIGKFEDFSKQFGQWKLVLDERVGNWSTQINRVDRQQAEHDRKLSGLQTVHTRMEGEVKALNTTVFGDVTHEGVPSLYELVNGINAELKLKNQQTDEKLQNLLQMATKSDAWIANFEAVQRARHERRWRWAKAVGNWMGRNQVIAAIITLLLVGLISVLLPQLGALLKAFFHIP